MQPLARRTMLAHVQLEHHRLDLEPAEVQLDRAVMHLEIFQRIFHDVGERSMGDLGVFTTISSF